MGLIDLMWQANIRSINNCSRAVDWVDGSAFISNDVCKRKGQIFKEKDSEFWFGTLGSRPFGNIQINMSIWQPNIWA